MEITCQLVVDGVIGISSVKKFDVTASDINEEYSKV